MVGDCPRGMGAVPGLAPFVHCRRVRRRWMFSWTGAERWWREGCRACGRAGPGGRVAKSRAESWSGCEQSRRVVWAGVARGVWAAPPPPSAAARLRRPASANKWTRLPLFRFVRRDSTPCGFWKRDISVNTNAPAPRLLGRQTGGDAGARIDLRRGVVRCPIPFPRGTKFTRDFPANPYRRDEWGVPCAVWQAHQRVQRC